MIWYLFRTDALKDCMDAAYACVSPVRRQRADDYRNAEGKRGQLAAGLLERFVLGTAGEPRAENPYGKPLLSDGRWYSLSHTDGVAALCAADFRVGLDVETVRACDLRVARRCFLPEERAFLESASDCDAAFTAVFTRKEAVIKAVGKGFSLPLTSFSVLPLADVRVEADAAALYLHTEWTGGVCVSLASEQSVPWECREITPEEVFCRVNGSRP